MTHFPQKVYKLSKAKFSRFERMRGDKNQIFRTKVPTGHCISNSMPLLLHIMNFDRSVGWGLKSGDSSFLMQYSTISAYHGVTYGIQPVKIVKVKIFRLSFIALLIIGFSFIICIDRKGPKVQQR